MNLTSPLLVLALLSQVAGQANTQRKAEPGPERWEKAIQALEQLDKKEDHPSDAILFLGSSSVRRWETIAEDMAPYPVIRRGYGGAKYSDLRVYAKRLTHPHEVRAIAIFVGNDVSGRPTDRTPQAVSQDVRAIIGDIRSKFTDTPIFFIAVTPTASRSRVWQKTQGVNAAIAEICSDLDYVHWIGTAAYYLNDQGQPRNELFVGDRLHLNEEGYDLWAKIIKRRLNRVLGESAKR